MYIPILTGQSGLQLQDTVVLMVDTQRAVCLVPPALSLAIKLRHLLPVVLRACL